MTAETADWLGACRRSVTAITSMLEARPTIAERVIETGTRGEGGDRTLEIDAAAEDIVFGELAALHDAGARFCAVSEERGMVDFGSEDVRVIIDPIDGSLNAKRGITHHALSIAVADGPTMADVFFGFVQDFGAQEEWLAWRGGGAQLDGIALDPSLGRAPQPARQARGRRRRVRRPALGREVRRRARGDHAPDPRDRRDRGLAVPGGGRPLRRDGLAEEVPGGGRRGGPADRARGGRARRVHRLRGPAVGAAGSRRPLARDRRAHR